MTRLDSVRSVLPRALPSAVALGVVLVLVLALAVAFGRSPLGIGPSEDSGTTVLVGPSDDPWKVRPTSTGTGTIAPSVTATSTPTVTAPTTTAPTSEPEPTEEETSDCRLLGGSSRAVFSGAVTADAARLDGVPPTDPASTTAPPESVGPTLTPTPTPTETSAPPTTPPPSSPPPSSPPPTSEPPPYTPPPDDPTPDDPPPGC